MDTHVTGKCPQCGATYRLRAHAIGRRARCKTCQQVFVIPGSQAVSPQKADTADDDVMSWLDRSTKGEDDGPKLAPDDEEDEDDDLHVPEGMNAPGSGTR